MVKKYYVYILTNRPNRVLYVGVTNNIKKRVLQHKQKVHEGFTKRYNVTKLIHYEETEDVRSAIIREKEIKGWLREKKMKLIKDSNPEFEDLSQGWYEEILKP
jgi:putative endonuclease